MEVLGRQLALLVEVVVFRFSVVWGWVLGERGRSAG